ncbi:radical SAM protein [archaeon]|jgi:Fe-coproporphyrin III synthase|nr:radical SAM protein [archaeon]MBT3577464.1 radical SAM protein [archaeon]MBT6820293.1 radical SAM protein [archaeon]MBT6955990.1 radical SAM protein [archaeon]MBT7025107.1 radical SAM protein [archaeon]
MNFPELAILKPTSRCNQNCKYCYDVKNPCEISLDEIKKIISYISQNGTKSVIISGGEPLLREDIGEIMAEIKSKGLNVFLDTNGDFFLDRLNEIERNIDILGLPLDGPSEEFSYRGKENFQNVIKILEHYKSKKERPKIRIGTVVTKENINLLEDIAKLIRNFEIDVWKIYQFMPTGPLATKNRAALEIDERSFLEAIKNLKDKNLQLNILTCSSESRKRAHFFIGSDGKVYVPEDEKGDCKILGSVFEKGTIEEWKRITDLKSYKENSEKVLYPLSLEEH